jgi:hypothetical protein
LYFIFIYLYKAMSSQLCVSTSIYDGTTIVRCDPEGKELVCDLQVEKDTKMMFLGFDTVPTGFSDQSGMFGLVTDTNIDWTPHCKSRETSTFLYQYGSTDKHGMIWMTPSLYKIHPGMNADGELVCGGIVLLLAEHGHCHLSIVRLHKRRQDSHHKGFAYIGEDPQLAGMRYLEKLTGIELEEKTILPLATRKTVHTMFGVEWDVRTHMFWSFADAPAHMNIADNEWYASNTNAKNEQWVVGHAATISLGRKTPFNKLTNYDILLAMKAICAFHGV